MIPYSELLNECLALLEINANDATRFKINEHLWQSQTKLLNTLPFHYLINAIKTVRFALLANQRDYQWPSDYMRLVDVWVDYTNSISETNPGNRAIPYRYGKRHVKSIDSLASRNYPFIDDNVEGGFGLYPVPTANVTEGIRLRYVWKVPAPTSNQDCLLEANLKNLLIYNTVSLSALIEEHNMELAKEMANLFKEELSQFLPKKEKE